MYRRKIILTAALLFVTGMLNIKAAEKPNILILYADDMGYGDLAIQNPESKIPTPNLDRLATEGLRFTDGHSSSGICTPSRYALLTGRHHWRKFYTFAKSFDTSSFDDEELTLPEMLRENGYTTAHIGKWHLGLDWDSILKPGKKLKSAKNAKDHANEMHPDDFDWSKQVAGGPLAHGFDTSFTDDVINFPPYTWIENDRVLKAPDTMMDEDDWKPIKEGNWECRPGPMVTGWDPYENVSTLTGKALAYIQKQANSDQPFFLYFALPSPHAPIVPKDEFDGKSQAGPYGDYIVESDDACGQLLRALDAAGIAENTVVIFSADNGSANYMMDRFLKFEHNSSGPFRGMKGDIWEGGHHVPFVIKWPGVTEPGSVSDALISQVDIMTTLAGALGYDIPEGQAEDGFNMMPVLRGEKDAIRDALVYNTSENKFGMRQGDWVFLGHVKSKQSAYERKADFPKETKKQGLYNLKEDIGQRNNVIDEYPEKVKELTDLLKKVRQSGYPGL